MDWIALDSSLENRRQKEVNNEASFIRMTEVGRHRLIEDKFNSAHLYEAADRGPRFQSGQKEVFHDRRAL